MDTNNLSMNLMSRLVAHDGITNEGRFAMGTLEGVILDDKTEVFPEVKFKTHDGRDGRTVEVEITLVRHNPASESTEDVEYLDKVSKDTYLAVQNRVMEFVNEIKPHFPDTHFDLTWPKIETGFDIELKGTKKVDTFSIEGIDGLFQRITRPDQDYAEFYVRTDMKAGGEFHEVDGMFGTDQISEQEVRNAWSRF